MVGWLSRRYGGIRRFSLLFLGAGLAAVLALAVTTSSASTPPSQAIAVPTSSGQTATINWTGTILPASHPTSSCATVSGDPTVDHHGVQLTVPAGIYSTVNAQFTFTISWTPVTPTEDTADEIITVLDPSGTVVGSGDSSSTTETVATTNLAPGAYDVLACGFANAAPQDYTGSLTITTTAASGTGGGEASLSSAPAQGLQFSAAVPADAQRDEAEPLMETDKAGNIYTCGPTGFSMAADYAQVSTDGGNQFHLLGIPPRGQQAIGGGGDCGLATGTAKNAQGNYPYAYAGLGALSGFSTSTSPNNGHSLATSGVDLSGGAETNGVGADRQWLTFIDPTTVLMAYNATEPHNSVVLKSTDSGLTYLPTSAIAAPNPRFLGPLRYDPVNKVAFFGWDSGASESGDSINLSMTKDGGTTWTDCQAAVAPADANGFVTVDSDNAGNIYLAYGEQSTFHTYLVALPAANVAKCNNPVVSGDSSPVNNPGFTKPVQVDRDAVRSTVFPWVAAEGTPGRVAVGFYGTNSDGNPNVGTFKASWNVYVNESLNALSPTATFSQVKVTTHPFHYDSICLNGLGCDLALPSPGDRTLADFFAVKYSPVSKKLSVVFDRTNKIPDESLGHVATPMVATQTAGPTLGGTTLGTTPAQPLVRTSSTDPTGDALSNYSLTAPAVAPPAPATANEPAADLTSVSVGPEIDLVDGSPITPGGVTVTMKVADLSTTALTNTLVDTTGKSLVYLFRFTNGYQDAGAHAAWNPLTGWSFGFNDYTVGSSPCESTNNSAAEEKCVVFPGNQPIQGTVNQATGTIQLSVPQYLLRGLSGSEADGKRPTEVPATVGTRFYDAEAMTMANTVSAVQAVQSWMYPLDNTPAMDFLLPSASTSSTGGDSGCKVEGGGSIPGAQGGEAKFTVGAHANLKGNNALKDKAAGVDFKSTSITSVGCTANGAATIQGAGFDNNASVTYTIKVADNGEPGSKDTYSISLSTGYADGPATLTKGNIQVKGS